MLFSPQESEKALTEKGHSCNAVKTVKNWSMRHEGCSHVTLVLRTVLSVLKGYKGVA